MAGSDSERGSDGGCLLRAQALMVMQEERYADIVDPNLHTSQTPPPTSKFQVAASCGVVHARSSGKMAECTSMLQGDGLAERWEGWQADAVDIQVSDLLSIIKSDDIRSKNDSGINWDTFEVELSSPR